LGIYVSFESCLELNDLDDYGREVILTKVAWGTGKRNFVIFLHALAYHVSQSQGIGSLEVA
jgi:hypothetical protein